jgi:hypothetical protein
MSTDIRTLAVYFIRAHRNATEQEAIDFAQERFPDAPVTVARFLADWVELKSRLASAMNHQGDMTWEPVRVADQQPRRH